MRIKKVEDDRLRLVGLETSGLGGALRGAKAIVACNFVNNAVRTIEVS